jgi:hypothetical protein
VSETFYRLIYFSILWILTQICSKWKIQFLDSLNAFETLSCWFFFFIWTYIIITWEQRHFRYRRIPCQASQVYAVLPRAVLVVKFPPFLICVHTEKIGGTLMKGSIYAGGRAVIPWNQFSSLQIKKSCRRIFDTVFFILSYL